MYAVAREGMCLLRSRKNGLNLRQHVEASEIISVDGGKDGDALYLRAENRLANIQKR